MNSTFQFFRSNPNSPPSFSTRPFLLSQQPPTRTASDQIRSSSKLHLQHQQPHAQRTTPGIPRLTSLQQLDTATATKSNKKSGFTLASPVIAAHEIEGEGDSDEWISSESMSVTPQNQSSDSESGDDDVVHNLPANLHLTGAAHIATSPDDREPPTPTIPQVKMQPPTPVTSAKEESNRRLPLASVPDELRTNAGLNDVDGRRAITSSADGRRADAVVASHLGQENLEDPDYRHSEHRARPEDGLASTPRPRAFVDRDTEPSRRLPPDFPSDPPHPDSSARKPPILNAHSSGGIQDLPQQRTLSAQSDPQSRPHTTGDSSADSRTDNHQPVQDRMTITQVSKSSPPKTPPALTTLVHLHPY